MQKRDFETYQKCFRDFEILPKFSETHVFWGTIRHPSQATNLMGHSQLMYMRIRYHFLADLHVTRHVRETESEKRIQNTQNKPCRVESPKRDYRP